MIDPRPAVVEVNNFLYATSQLSQTTLRSVLGEAELDELLSEREKLNLRLQSILDQHTAAWGVKVSMVEVKQVDLAELITLVLLSLILSFPVTTIVRLSFESRDLEGSFRSAGLRP